MHGHLHWISLYLRVSRHLLSIFSSYKYSRNSYEFVRTEAIKKECKRVNAKGMKVEQLQNCHDELISSYILLKGEQCNSNLSQDDTTISNVIEV